MIRFKTKLSLYNLLSKLVFTALFLVFLPSIIERIHLRQIDNTLVQNREQVMSLISRVGIEPFLTSDTTNTFGSYNILKEEFISLEKIDTSADLNYIDVSNRLIDDDQISYRVINYSFTADSQKYLLSIGKSLASILQSQKNTYNIILGFLAFIIIITMLTDLFYTRILLSPLEAVTNKLKGISKASGFDRTPVKTSTYDFYRLDTTLRELMDRINEAFRKEKEITTNISHELLTPVSVLRSKLENLLLMTDINPEVTVKIEESLKTLYRLQGLVNSLLMIARIESHQYIREDSFSVVSLLDEVISELLPLAEDKGIALKGELTRDANLTDANRALMFSMFYNVVGNAIKNTGKEGEIIVRSKTSHGGFTVDIDDTGKGMTEAEVSTIFSRFRQGMGASGSGTGIGLAITKSIADFHNVSIKVNSEPGKGTHFSFAFPANS
jgi:signal transduction histidine kinase